MAQFEPGHARLGGRKPGSPARKISQLKSQLLNAARAAGTQISNDEKEPRRGGTTRYLKWLALNHPDLFCGLLKSCLPKEIESTITADVTGHAGAPASTNHSINSLISNCRTTCKGPRPTA